MLGTSGARGGFGDKFGGNDKFGGGNRHGAGGQRNERNPFARADANDYDRPRDNFRAERQWDW